LKLWLAEHKIMHCWLFGDQLGAHKCADLVAEARKSSLMWRLFPANTSHFLQPLDDVVFASFKHHLKIEWKGVNWITRLTPFHFNFMLYHLAYQSEEKSFRK
jgi:hypothetical protein